MKKDQIHLGDWKRILIGDAPAEFLIEVLIRTLLIYMILLVTMRLLGKRMNGQLTNLEMIVMLTLGAIISPAMQLPDRGLLSGVLALVCALAFLRGTNLWGFRSSKAEKVLQGTATVLIKDGVILLEEMSKNRLSHQQVYAALRNGEVYNIGKVKRLYLEAYGMFSIFEAAEAKPGLSVLPPDDDEIHTIHRSTDGKFIACKNCGTTIAAPSNPGPCPNCQANEWVAAVI